MKHFKQITIYLLFVLGFSQTAITQTSFPKYNDLCHPFEHGRYKSLLHFYDYLDSTGRDTLFKFSNFTQAIVKSIDSYDFSAYGYPQGSYFFLNLVGSDPTDSLKLAVEFSPLKIDTVEGYFPKASELLFTPGDYILYMGFRSNNHPRVNIYFNGLIIAEDLNVSYSNPWLYDRATQTVIPKWDGLGGYVDTVNIPGKALTGAKIKVEFNRLGSGTLEELKIYHWALVPVKPGTVINYVTSNDTSNVVHLGYNNRQNVDSVSIFRVDDASQKLSLIALLKSDVNEYVDTSIDNRLKSYQYTTSSKSICGAVTDTTINHRTIHLTGYMNADGSIHLNWSTYKGLGVSSYAIYRSDNYGPFTLIGEPISSSTNFDDITTSFNRFYQYYITFKTNNSKVPSSVNIQSNNVLIDNKSTSSMLVDQTPVSLVPSPVKGGFLKIQKTKKESVRIQLIDLSGRICLTKEIGNNQGPINISFLPAGVYIVSLSSQNNIFYQGKIVKVD